MLTITLNPVAALADPDAGNLVAFDVSFDERIYLVTATKPLDYQTPNDGGAIFPKTQGERPQNYRVYREEDGQFRLLLTIEHDPFNFHHIQPLKDGRFLLVCARSRYRDGDSEANARIFDSNGECVSSFTIGDGVQDVGVASDGRIWASYFDEGVFGNFGWDQPLGRSGLVAWNSRGSQIFEYSPVNGLDRICDCYAMNVSGEDVWIYYYTDFPLVQIRNFRTLNHWDMPISGSDGFAVSDSAALFRGGYNQRDRYHLISLSNPEPKIVLTFELRDARGRRIEADRVAGRGESIFLLRDAEVFQLTVQAVTEETAALPRRPTARSGGR